MKVTHGEQVHPAVVVTYDAPPADDADPSEPGPAVSEWADLNVDDTLAKVHGGAAGTDPTDGWQERALAALEYEETRSNPRKGVVEPLTLQLEQATHTDAPDGPDAVDS